MGHGASRSIVDESGLARGWRLGRMCLACLAGSAGSGLVNGGQPVKRPLTTPARLHAADVFGAG